MNLDTSPEDVDQSLPLEVFRVRAETEPIAALSLSAILVLRLLDLASFVVSVDDRLTNEPKFENPAYA